MLRYKAGPGRDLEMLRGAFVELLDHRERVAGGVLRLTRSARWAEIRGTVAGAGRKSELRAVEDELDAIVCALPGRPTVPARRRRAEVSSV